MFMDSSPVSFKCLCSFPQSVDESDDLWKESSLIIVGNIVCVLGEWSL